MHKGGLNMNWYARFKNDIKDDKGNMIYKANVKSKSQTRYAIIDEDEEHLYIANIPNNINCTEVSRFKKEHQESLFDMVEE
jgi:hypothetical protein